MDEPQKYLMNTRHLRIASVGYREAEDELDALLAEIERLKERERLLAKNAQMTADEFIEQMYDAEQWRKHWPAIEAADKACDGEALRRAIDAAREAE